MQCFCVSEALTFDDAGFSAYKFMRWKMCVDSTQSVDTRDWRVVKVQHALDIFFHFTITGNKKFSKKIWSVFEWQTILNISCMLLFKILGA